ncbi:Uncharacterised protein [Pragia fontium]|uniref:imm11 family protein n=1 Tax=Pragia fontium TaxID=82985 RepID=UPI000DFD16F2|nr:DUF1629 domain-containing protein [Pragia fontium]SUB84233.1 Uncharacterised protein [Pragia fontium]
MNFYTISNLNWNGGLIDFSNAKSRLSSFFIWNEGDGRFLHYSKPKGKAQISFQRDKLINSDYLPANIGIPLFSKKAKDVFEKRISSEMSFYECSVECEGSDELFFLCKVENYLSIIDEEQSSFRQLLDGTKLIDIPSYKCDELFFIARDKVFCERLIVSQKFVDTCDEEGIHMDFIRC